jgi:hypothetical protein
MGSIATTRGDGGQTGLAGGIRVSKASRRVDTYGTVDQLISVLGFARSICGDSDIIEFARGIQRELFTERSRVTAAYTPACCTCREPVAQAAWRPRPRVARDCGAIRSSQLAVHHRMKPGLVIPSLPRRTFAALAASAPKHRP